MTTTFTRTAIAAVFAAATVGMTGAATAGVEQPPTNKYNAETAAVPAANVVRQGGTYTAADQGQKHFTNERYAFGVAQPDGRQIVTVPHVDVGR